jgi:hypothetical protein
VKLYAAIRCLLAACLIVGIFLAPFTVSRPAQASSSAVTMGSMECCPKAPVHKTCPKCPLMALCMTAFVAAQSECALIGLKTAFAVTSLIPSSEPIRAGLSFAPPARPPRVLI